LIWPRRALPRAMCHGQRHGSPDPCLARQFSRCFQLSGGHRQRRPRRFHPRQGRHSLRPPRSGCRRIPEDAGRQQEPATVPGRTFTWAACWTWTASADEASRSTGEFEDARRAQDTRLAAERGVKTAYAVKATVATGCRRRRTPSRDRPAPVKPQPDKPSCMAKRE